MSSFRQRRVADQIRVILSDLLLREMSDPRLRHVSITRVELTRDLRIAHVYFGRFSGGEQERKQSAKALGWATTHLRHALGSRLKIRYTPELHFHEDRSVDHAIHIDQVLEELAGPDKPEEEPS
jgi:ribosome-binding factor A